MKKVLKIFACVLLCIALIGCSEKKSKVVRLSVWASDQDNKMIQQMIDSFIELHKHQAIFEITLCKEGEQTCKDTVLLSPQTAADVFSFADDQLDDLIRANALSKITTDKELIIQENGGIGSTTIEACSWDGDLYCYPAVASNGYFLYYNKNFLNSEQVKSMEELLSTADSHNRKFAMDLASGWYMYGFYKAAGMDVYMNPDGVTTTCEWNKTTGPYTGVDVTESILNLVNHKSFVSMTSEELEKEFQTKNLIIACISGTWNEKIIRNAMGNGYAATKLPTFNVNGDDLQMHSVIGYKVLGVNAYSREQEWAHELAKYITNRDNQLVRFWKRGEIPTNTTVAGSDRIKEESSVYALSLQSPYGHQQIVGDSFWNASYSFGNVIASGNIEGYDIQYLLNELVENCAGK